MFWNYTKHSYLFQLGCHNTQNLFQTHHWWFLQLSESLLGYHQANFLPRNKPQYFPTVILNHNFALPLMQIFQQHAIQFPLDLLNKHLVFLPSTAQCPNPNFGAEVVLFPDFPTTQLAASFRSSRIVLLSTFNLNSQK